MSIPTVSNFTNELQAKYTYLVKIKCSMSMMILAGFLV